MASIRRRNGKYQVQVRVHGYPPQSKTFHHRKDAERWAKEQELAIEKGLAGDTSKLKEPFRSILSRYDQEIAAPKRSYVKEKDRLARLMRDPISDTPIFRLSPEELAKFRDRRLKNGKRTCHYDLVLIGHALKVAMREWGYPLARNPADQVSKPGFNRPRARRLTATEYQSLEQASATCRNRFMWPLINLAITTGMRRGELLSLRWDHIDLEKRIAVLPITKNGEERKVPLSDQAVQWLVGLRGNADKPFPTTPLAIRLSWERLLKRAKIEDLHFHDLRHEAVSRFFEKGLSVPEVALISGHKDFRMLARYTHLRAEDVARKMQ